MCSTPTQAGNELTVKMFISVWGTKKPAFQFLLHSKYDHRATSPGVELVR